MAEVRISRDAQRHYDALPRAVRARILGVIERLQLWPQVSGAKSLRGELAGKHRIRTGDYRVQFSVRVSDGNEPNETDVVLIERIGHRDGFYEE